MYAHVQINKSTTVNKLWKLKIADCRRITRKNRSDENNWWMDCSLKESGEGLKENFDGLPSLPAKNSWISLWQVTLYFFSLNWIPTTWSILCCSANPLAISNASWPRGKEVELFPVRAIFRGRRRKGREDWGGEFGRASKITKHVISQPIRR